MKAPTRDRPKLPKGYITTTPKGMLSWSAVEGLFRGAPYFWIATTNADGRPHLVQQWAVWIDQQLFFEGSERTGWARNLARDPRISFGMQSGNSVAYGDGTAEVVRSVPAALARRIGVVLVRDLAAQLPRGLDQQLLGLRDRQRAPALGHRREIQLRLRGEGGERAVPDGDDPRLGIAERAAVDDRRVEAAPHDLVDRRIGAADHQMGCVDPQAGVVQRAEVREREVRAVLVEVDLHGLDLLLQVGQAGLVPMMAVGDVHALVLERRRELRRDRPIVQRPQEMPLLADPR